MKISVLTATYNREKLLDNLYQSLLKNSKYNVCIEWLIMDDGSSDDTKTVVQKYINENKIEIQYFYQENQGKMRAINNLVSKAQGELIIECDSDDYFTEDAFEIIKGEYEKCQKGRAYALCFLKYDKEGNNIGNNFKKARTTMFDLYFKEGEMGEKALVYFADIRKKYMHKLEKEEKFVTEARMYHEMDLEHDMICINKPIMVCEYQKEGYTKNISQQFAKNPYGYYEYFREILNRDMRKVTFNKRLYAIKHYILFSYLTKKYNISDIFNWNNKILYILLWVPGILKSKKFKLRLRNCNYY